MIKHIFNQITDELSVCPFINSIVLGGSRVTGMATDKSDIDVGIYYDKGQVDFKVLNEIASRLDDMHRDDLICEEGGWGKWVNCGGWLTIGGFQVDLILRDINRVADCIRQTDEGNISAHYQTGHPHAFLNVMYRGELASCQTLYAKDARFLELKAQAETYPDRLAEALVSFFLFEANFSCMLAQQYGTGMDVYYKAGHLFRSVSALNQVLFALNRTYCLNEKKATLRINQLRIAPQCYHERVNKIFSLCGEDTSGAVEILRQLIDEVETEIQRI